MNVLIIEDERPAADRLVSLLKETGEPFRLLGVLETVEQSINWLSVHPAPDLIFMDIQLDDGTCFEIFEQSEVGAPVIFVTAYDEYAIRAFRVNSIDYLLKPTDLPSLKTALDKYRNLFVRGSGDYTRLTGLIEQLGRSYKARFFIRVGNRYKSVQAEDINYFYIEGRSTFMRTRSGHSYDLEFSLSELEGMVDPKKFFRISRSHMVNIRAIKDILAYSAGKLFLVMEAGDPDERLSVSRDRVKEFKTWMDR